MNEMIETKLKHLPSEPGCYLMKNAAGKIIYVGKAKKLKNRVTSYFVGAHDYKTTKLVSQIADFDYIVTHSEKEALILEINLIKQHRPRYNIMFMDDKSYPYIKLSSEDYPFLRVVREKKQDPKAMYFGPYPDASAAWNATRLLNEIFPLRKCHPLRKQKCLYYHLGQCLAPCEELIDKEVALEMKNKVIQVLRGNHKELMNDLTYQMMQASDTLEFEKALVFKHQIEGLEYITSKQHVQTNDKSSMDVFNYAIVNGYVCFYGLFFRNGQMLRKNMFIEPIEIDIQDALVSYLVQYYEKNPKPKELIVSDNLDSELLSEVLTINVSTGQRGRKRQLLEMAEHNAKHQLEVKFESVKEKDDVIEAAYQELSTMLYQPELNRIDIMDVSHTSGSNPVGATVVFERGIPVKSLYRKYKLHQANDDLKSMQEMTYRRYLRGLKQEDVLADLLIVDGGENQVRAVKDVLRSLEIDLKVVGLKKDEYHATKSLVTEDLEEIELDKRSPLYLHLAAMQDEIHRFAISFHKQLRTKQMTRSQLDDFIGIGPKRKQLLLKHFGSFKKIKEASLGELVDVLGEKTGNLVYNQLRDKEGGQQ